MMTVDQGVEWMVTEAPDEVMMTVVQEESLMMTVGPVETWMNPEGLDVGQMMTGAPEEEGMMRGEAAGVWMTLDHVVEMTLDPGNLLGDQVDGESERKLGKKAGDLLVILTMMMVSVKEMTVMRETDLEIDALQGKKGVAGEEVVVRSRAVGATLAVKNLTVMIVVNAVT